MWDAEFAFPTCVVCRDPGSVVVADCDTQRLPVSGARVRAKLAQWRRERCPSLHWPLLERDDDDGDGGGESAPLCETCLALIADVEQREAELDESFASLWRVVEQGIAADPSNVGEEVCEYEIVVETEDGVVESAEVVQVVNSYPRRDVPDPKPAPVLEPCRKSSRPSVARKSASIARKLKEREIVRESRKVLVEVERLSDEKIDELTNKKVIAVEQEEPMPDEDEDDNDSDVWDPRPSRDEWEPTTSEDDDEDIGDEGAPSPTRRRHRTTTASMEGLSRYAAVSLGKLGTEYVERRSGLRGSEAWFKVRECRLCNVRLDGRVTELLRHHEAAHGILLDAAATGITCDADRSPFVCHMCFAGFHVFWEYVAHVMYEELAVGEKGGFACRLCGENCMNPRRLESHFAEDHADDDDDEEDGDGGGGCGPFVCPECDEAADVARTTFATFDDYVQHRQSYCRHARHSVRVGRGSRLELACPGCGFLAETCRELAEHGKKAAAGGGGGGVDGDGDGDGGGDQSACAKPFRCPADGCGVKFESLVGLERHLAVVEFCPMRYCDPCGQKFPTPMDGEQHMNRVHLQQRPCVCDVCGRSYESRVRLNQHKAMHVKQAEETAAGREKVCYLCGKLLLGGRRAVENHIDRFCGKDFYYQNLLNKHMAKEHDFKKYRIEYPCNVCQKVFTSSDSVHVHRFLIHKIRDPNMKVYVCPECGKEFVKRSAFDNHLVSHTGTKPHPCPICDQRFITFSNLAGHTRKVHGKRIRRVQVKDKVVPPFMDPKMNFEVEVPTAEEEAAPNIVPVSAAKAGDAIGKGPGYVILFAADEGAGPGTSRSGGKRGSGAGKAKKKKIIQVGDPLRFQAATGSSITVSSLPKNTHQILRVEDLETPVWIV